MYYFIRVKMEVTEVDRDNLFFTWIWPFLKWHCGGLDFRIVPGHFWAAALASGSVSEVRTNKLDGFWMLQ